MGAQFLIITHNQKNGFDIYAVNFPVEFELLRVELSSSLLLLKINKLVRNLLDILEQVRKHQIMTEKELAHLNYEYLSLEVSN